MARPASKKTRRQHDNPWRIARGYLRRWAWRTLFGFVAFVFALVALFVVVNPPTTLYMAAEKSRLDGLKHEWVDFDQIAPVMARSVVAAEDANFCNHWGFDMGAIRQVIEAGENRGASTITQQVVKNVYLWPARSWPRKALEALITPVVELVWSKQRILEVYLNMIEFDEGVFGVGAASRHYFGIEASALSADQAARLAAVLPAPKDRSAAKPSQFVARRSASIRDGAATILRDGRTACFED